MSIFPIDEKTRGYIRQEDGEAFEEYSAILRRLRAPDGCPWDRKQTLESMRRFLLEEAHEAVAAIDDHLHRNAPQENIGDELGDIFIVTMLTILALETSGGMTLKEVLSASAAKLLRRHPHVFGDVEARDADAVVRTWNRIKEEQEGTSSDPDAVSFSLPPLARALEIQKKAARCGFDWDEAEPVYRKITEELQELRESVTAGDITHIEEETGDLLFSMVNLARHLKIDPALALSGANEKFLRRYRSVAARLKDQGITMSDATMEELDDLWETVKQDERPRETPGENGAAD